LTTAAVLAATVDAVIETGPATGLMEIARRAGVTKGALQHHFRTKNDLMTAVVSDGWNDLVERLERVSDESTSAADRVRSIVREMWLSYQQPLCRAAFMISSDPNISDDLDSRLSPLFAAVRDRLDTLWNESFADLGVPDDRLAHARRFARSHLLGMLVQRQLQSTEPDPSLELSMLSRATLQLMLSTEPT
jgi:AcrR family transcriptional regulator